MKSTNEIFIKLKTLLVKKMGLNSERVILEAALRCDLNIRGDDGDELFELIEQHFDVDWTGVDSAAIFGPEGLFQFDYAQLEDGTYVEQECSIRDIVNLIYYGKWQGDIVRPVSEKKLKKRINILRKGYLLGGFLFCCVAWLVLEY
jgi:hypothetical protein